MKVLIISGRAGSGKSVILQALEDMQFYCVDNLPPNLLPDLLTEMQDRDTQVAISIDARNVTYSEAQTTEIIRQIKAGHDCQILYLDADDETLIRRFKETRRRHPLTNQKISLSEALVREHQILASITELADLKIDTKALTPQQLRQIILEFIQQQDSPVLNILIESFGYKYGIPHEANFIFDVRCLPNPYWDTKLRHKPGTDPTVIRYLKQHESCQLMYKDIVSFLLRWIPAYQLEQRQYLTIAIGCTGGIHRSVYIANEVYSDLKQHFNKVKIHHRELT